VEDRELKREVRRAARGDRDAAAVLFDAYHPRLYRYALAKLRSPSDAEDVAAETFARVLGQLDRFTWKGGGFEAWLFRIASNLVVDRVRISAREKATDQPIELEVGSKEPLPEDQVARLETGEELGMLLSALPDDQREVLLLRFAAGLDTHETGAVMGRNANAIRQLQFRALANVRNMMEVTVAT
jgi:RNA polymerase sigma-70 factor, ECF subfamily